MSSEQSRVRGGGPMGHWCIVLSIPDYPDCFAISKSQDYDHVA